MFQNIPSPTPSLMPEGAFPGMVAGKVGKAFSLLAWPRCWGWGLS